MTVTVSRAVPSAPTATGTESGTPREPEGDPTRRAVAEVGERGDQLDLLTHHRHFGVGGEHGHDIGLRQLDTDAILGQHLARQVVRITEVLHVRDRERRWLAPARATT